MNWDGVSEQIGVKRCRECSNGDHQSGWTSRSTYTVHWADRRMTKLGLRRFLILCASIWLMPVQSEWERLYAYNYWAQRKAREMHIRIPSRYADNDRARVRWLISNEQNIPAHVRRWANRSSTHAQAHREQADQSTSFPRPSLRDDGGWRRVS